MSHTPSQNGMFDAQGHDSHKVVPHQLDEVQRVPHAEATDPSHHHQSNPPRPQTSHATKYDMEWAQAHVDKARLERFVSDYLDRMSPSYLQSTLQKIWHRGCGLPITIWATDYLGLHSVEAGERGQTLYVTYKTATEVEADVDPVGGYPTYSQSMTFDLEAYTTVRIIVDKDDDCIADMSLEDVMF